MTEEKLKKLKIWYFDAVKSDLILNYGLTEKSALQTIKKYGLQKMLDEYPDVQLICTIEDTTAEMYQMGLVAKMDGVEEDEIN